MTVRIIFSIAILMVFCADVSFAQGHQTKATITSDQQLSFVLGEHPINFLKRNPLIVKRLRVLLGGDYTRFYEGLSVSSGFEKHGEYYIVSGCVPHSCPDQSHVAFEFKTSSKSNEIPMYVIVENYDWKQPRRFYSTKAQKMVPVELAAVADIDAPEYGEKLFLPDYMTRPFVFLKTGEKLPSSNFLGNSPWRIFNVLEERQSSIIKDEFETTIQFIQRKERELSLPLAGAMTVKDKLAFRSIVFGEYDADRSILHISIPKTPCSISPDIKLNLSRFACIPLSDDLNVSNYSTLTEYGRKVEVTKMHWELYGLIVNGAEEWDTKKESPPYRYAEQFIFHVPMNVEMAKRVKENLEALFVGSVVEPYTAQSVFRSAATVGYPNEEVTNSHLLVFDLDRILFFDKVSGEIVYTQKFSLGK
jgi:hypothetical protein